MWMACVEILACECNWHIDERGQVFGEAIVDLQYGFSDVFSFVCGFFLSLSFFGNITPFGV